MICVRVFVIVVIFRGGKQSKSLLRRLRTKLKVSFEIIIFSGDPKKRWIHISGGGGFWEISSNWTF